MLPALIKKYDFTAADGKQSHVHLFDTGIIGRAFRSRHIDFEVTPVEDASARVSIFLEALPENVVVKFKSRSAARFAPVPAFYQRAKAFDQIGYVTKELIITAEKSRPKISLELKKLFSAGMKDTYLDDFIHEFHSKVDEKLFSHLGLQIKEDKNPVHGDDHSIIKQAKCGLQIDDSYYAIVKLHKLSTNALSIQELIYMRESLPLPSEICLSVEKLDERESQLRLKAKSKQEESASDMVSAAKKDDTEKIRADIILGGKKLFKIELSITLRGQNEEELAAQAYRVKREFKRIGDFDVETFGAFEGYRATLFGAKTHVTNIELIDKIDLYVPIFILGSDREIATTPRSFCFHREDNTVDYLEVFNKNYSNYSGIVIGRSGRGKSVFTNNLLRCLNHDEKATVILVDVKGSHTNTVKMLGGQVHEISSSDACGISPFEFLRKRRDPPTIEIVLDFIEKIMLEDGELNLSRAEQVQVEKELMAYVEAGAKDPSIDDFLKFTTAVPRRESLERWRKNGLYGKLFSPYQSNQEARIQYFDFKDIVTAAKGGVSTAVMSAIMAHFNFRLLDKSIDETLIFIADETPFFVRNCFSSFNLLQKNVRKLGGSQILVAQNLSDLVVGGDTSLVNQTEFRVFFSRDEGSSTFKEVSGLSDRGMSLLEQFNSRKGKYSEFILKDSIGERKGKLVLSREEYLRSTTFSEDNSKIDQLRNVLGIQDKNKTIEVLATLQEEYAIQI